MSGLVDRIVADVQSAKHYIANKCPASTYETYTHTHVASSCIADRAHAALEVTCFLESFTD